MWTADEDVNMKAIFAVMNTTRAVVKIRPEKKFRPVRDLNPWPLQYRRSALVLSGPIISKEMVSTKVSMARTVNELLLLKFSPWCEDDSVFFHQIYEDSELKSFHFSGTITFHLTLNFITRMNKMLYCIAGSAVTHDFFLIPHGITWLKWQNLGYVTRFLTLYNLTSSYPHCF